MTDESGAAFDLDLAVSSLASDSSDTQLMMRLLIDQLAAVLGSRLQVRRGSRLMKKATQIRGVEIRVGDNEFVAELDGAQASFLIGRVSGGIRIRADRCDAAAWIRTLLEGLQKEAQHSTATRQALEAIVIGGN